MMDSQDIFTAKNSPSDLEYFRNRTIKELGFTPDFTCSTCVWAPTCIFAFDGYNTDGDCLAEK